MQNGSELIFPLSEFTTFHPTKDDHNRGKDKRRRESPPRRSRRESPPRRGRSPRKEPAKKAVDSVSKKEAESSEEEDDKGKRPFVASIIGGFMKEDVRSSSDEEDPPRKRGSLIWPIASIVGGLPSPRGPSMGTLKRKMTEMLSIEGKASTSSKKSDRPILGFSDEEYVGGAPNEIFPMIIVATMANYDVSRILIDQGSSCDIMYEELFEKLGLKKENLAPYTGTDLQGFNGSSTRPWGFVELPVTFEDGKSRESRKTINVIFLVVPCKSVYNCIMGRPTLATLGAVPSTVHLKMKYHNSKNEVITIEADLAGARRCHKTLQKAVNAATKDKGTKNKQAETLMIDHGTYISTILP